MAINKRLIATEVGGGGAACTTDTLQILGDSSCIAYYKMADATDESGSYNGTPTDVNFNVEGKYGLAGSFNGSSTSKITTSLGINPTNAFSMSFWIKSDLDSSSYKTFGSAGTSNTSFIVLQKRGDNNAGRFLIYNNAIVLDLTDTTPMEVGVWTHYAITLTGSVGNLYKNGVNTVSNVSYSNSINYPNLTFGQRFFTPSEFFTGSIDQVRIYNTALNPNDVWLLYSETSATSSTLDYPASTGAQALYELEGDANDTGGTYNGTATDVAWVPLYDGTPTAMTYAAPSVSAPFLKAAVFNGSSSYIDTNTTFTPDLMSFSAWVKTNTISPATAKQIISNRGGAGTNYLGIDVGITPNGNIYNRFDNGGSRGDSNSDTVPIPLNTWTHLAFTIDMSNSIQKVYKNGVFVYQETTSGSIASGNDFYIGRYFSGADYWEGSIDQVRIFNKALDAGEILQLYNEPNN